MAIHRHNDNPNIIVHFLRYLFGFCLAEVQKFSVWGFWANDNAPGETWAYTSHGPLYKVCLTMHIVVVIPAGLLATLQFIPIIRYKLLIFHQLNGYVVMLLMLLFSITGIIISKVSFGGDFATQVFAGFFGIVVTLSMALAYINIKRLQIEQHRAWMMRAWVYSGSIITLRLIQIIASVIIGKICDSYRSISCQQLPSVGAAEEEVSCAADPNGWTAVKMDFDGVGVAEVMAALQGTFAGAGLLALFLHAIGIELYLHLTPAEAERLRKVSYERQLERGLKRPGSAGLTSDRLGDAVWTPPGNGAESLA